MAAKHHQAQSASTPLKVGTRVGIQCLTDVPRISQVVKNAACVSGLRAAQGKYAICSNIFEYHYNHMTCNNYADIKVKSVLDSDLHSTSAFATLCFLYPKASPSLAFTVLPALILLN